MSRTWSSPRYPESIRPGALGIVIPWRRARPERGSTRPAWPGGDRDRDPGRDARPLAGPEARRLDRVQVEAGVAVVGTGRQARVVTEAMDS